MINHYIILPAGRGCRPEVSHGTNSLGFVLGFHFVILGFDHSFEQILLPRLT